MRDASKLKECKKGVFMWDRDAAEGFVWEQDEKREFIEEPQKKLEDSTRRIWIKP
jgi:cytochrome c2